MNNTYEQQQLFIEAHRERLEAASHHLEEAEAIAERFENDEIYDMAERFYSIAWGVRAAMAKAVLFNDIELLNSVNC